MKNILLVFVFSVTLLSCEKELPPRNLIGQWETYRIEIWQKDYDQTQPLMVDKDKRAIYVFHSEGKYDDGGIKGTYVLNGNTIRITTEDSQIDMRYSFTGIDLVLEYIIDNHTAIVYLKRIK